MENNTTIALVWSLTNEFKDMPYSISRVGKSKKEGGTGVQWKCTCASFIHRGSKTCKHLIMLREGAKSGTILADSRFQITELGIKILKLQPILD